MPSRCDTEHLGRVIHETFTSPNECDRNGETANGVDAIYALSRAIDRLAAAVEKGLSRVSGGLDLLAEATEARSQ